MDINNKFLVGVFNDDEILLNAVKNIRKHGIIIHDVYTPFAIHGLDEALGLEDSRLHTAGFLFGMTGTATAVTLMSWITSHNFMTNYGGKPFWAIPAFVPITFEVTVLFAAVGMTLTFLIKSNLLPGVKPRIMDHRVTDDKFIISFDMANHSNDEVEKIKSLLKENGAEEINYKEF